MLKPKIENKCDTCVFEFACCKSKPVFAIDKYPELNLAHKKEADAVVDCDNYQYLDYNRDSKDAGTIELIVGKNRSGQTGTAKALFDRELTRFRNYVDDRADYSGKHWQD